MPILFHSMIFWLFVFQGIIVALDKSEPKISKLNQNCDRLGVCCVKSFVFDGVKALDPDKQMDPDNSTGMSFDCLFIALVVNKIIDFERTENNLKYSCRVYSCVLDFQRTYYVWGHKFSLITNWLLLWIQKKLMSILGCSVVCQTVLVRKIFLKMGRHLQPGICYWLLSSFSVLLQYLLSSDLYISVSLPASPPYPSGSFDHILLDAPCSALGQRPQFVVKMTLKELQSYPRLQRKLFTTVSNIEFLWLVKYLSSWQLTQPLLICALMQATIIIIFSKTHPVILVVRAIWLVPYLRVILHYSCPKEWIMHDPNSTKWLV